MLLVFMRRVIEQSSSAGSLSESIEVLRVLSLAASSLTRMARTQQYPDTRDLFWVPNELLNIALDEVNKVYEKEGEKIYSFRFVFRGTNPPTQKGKIPCDIPIHFTSLPRGNSSTHASKKAATVSRKPFLPPSI
jgi:hypothetical protein